MARIALCAGQSQWSTYGKQLIAKSMFEKGKAFLGAAMLLRQRGAYEYAVPHLLCQGIEILGKGFLLSDDYDTYKLKLRGYGHNLVKLLGAVEKASNISILKPVVRQELETLSSLYAQHLLRYGSGYDILVNPTTIPSRRVLLRVKALMRRMEWKS